MEEFKEEIKFGKSFIYWIIAVMFVVGGITWFFNTASKTASTALIHYEEFQELYNTCEKINTDICNMKDLPETDKMFESFSKAQRINTLKTNLNRWVEDYNAKSKMWNRVLWKSSQLPYQLSTQQFNCY
jgi:hypothetical protein